MPGKPVFSCTQVISSFKVQNGGMPVKKAQACVGNIHRHVKQIVICLLWIKYDGWLSKFIHGQLNKVCSIRKITAHTERKYPLNTSIH